MKSVFILGAGSSIGHSNRVFPSINQFFRSAKKLNLDLSGEYKLVAEYAQKVKGVDIRGKAGLNIEDFFTHLEIDLERNSSPELFSTQEQLLKLIQQVLLRLSDKLESKDGDYHKFKENLNDKNDTIITFNWDLLLDNVFNRIDVLKRPCYYQVKRGSYYRNFVFELSAFSQWIPEYTPILPPYIEWKPEHGYYLKMHGSIDWFYCSNEQCRACFKVFPVFEPEKPWFCSECHEQLRCLIIPPVLNKSYRQYPLIRQIWNVAVKEMSMAEELIIWGYSLPPTDFYASWLLSQARQASLRRITIINPGVIGKRKKKVILSFVRKFYDIFRDKLPMEKESVRLYEDYSDFCENREVFTKYSLGKKSEFYRKL